MVEQMVCKRDKAHCSPIRRRFLTLIVAALLLTTAEAQTERVPWSKRTKTSVLVARRDARAKHERGFATEGGCWNPVVWVNKGEPLLFSDREG